MYWPFYVRKYNFRVVQGLHSCSDRSPSSTERLKAEVVITNDTSDRRVASATIHILNYMILDIVRVSVIHSMWFQTCDIVEHNISRKLCHRCSATLLDLWTGTYQQKESQEIVYGYLLYTRDEKSENDLVLRSEGCNGLLEKAYAWIELSCQRFVVLC